MSRNAKILDCGCGTGRLIKSLRKFGFKNITGVDASEEMVHECTSLDGAMIIKSDVLEMSDHIKSDSFDVVIISNIMHHLTNQKAWRDFLTNCHRSLKAGGHLIIREPDPTWIVHLLIWMSKRRFFYLGALKYILQSFVEEKELLKNFFTQWVPQAEVLIEQHGFKLKSQSRWLVHRFMLCQKI